MGKFIYFCVVSVQSVKKTRQRVFSIDSKSWLIFRITGVSQIQQYLQNRIFERIYPYV